MVQGTYTLISLAWTRAMMGQTAVDHAATPPLESPPPPQLCTTALPPLSKEDTEPLQELTHQQPAPQAETPLTTQPPQYATPASNPRPSGVQKYTQGQTKTATPPPPTLRHIVLNDLRDTARLLALFEQAQQHGWIGHSDSARLTFLATAEHACVIGSSNPCGLFAALIRHQRWHYVTDSDEDAAATRLKQHLYGQGPLPRPAPVSPAPEPPALSKDAFIVRELQREVTRRGWQGDLWTWVYREDPTWSRARWDCAAAEVAQAQAAWQHASALNRVGDLMAVGDTLDCLGVSTAEEDTWRKTHEEDCPEVI
jgi:hypothetical protein